MMFIISFFKRNKKIKIKSLAQLQIVQRLYILKINLNIINTV